MPMPRTRHACTAGAAAAQRRAARLIGAKCRAASVWVARVATRPASAATRHYVSSSHGSRHTPHASSSPPPYRAAGARQHRRVSYAAAHTTATCRLGSFPRPGCRWLRWAWAWAGLTRWCSATAAACGRGGRAAVGSADATLRSRCHTRRASPSPRRWSSCRCALRAHRMYTACTPHVLHRIVCGGGGASA